jgi:hypothetical protein
MTGRAPCAARRPSAFPTGRKRRLARLIGRREDHAVQPDTLLSRDEAVAILIAVGDMNRNVARIKFLLEQEFGGEEGLEEDDA